MKKAIGPIVLVVLVAVLIAGCTSQLAIAPPSLKVTAVTRYTHPVASLGGFPVSLQVSGGNGEYVVNWGDGSSGSDLSHLYVPPIRNQYRVVVRSGLSSKAIWVHIQNNPPTIFALMLDPGWKAKTIIDLRYQKHGCHNGQPVITTGVIDPDGDRVQVILHATTGGVEDMIYNAARQPIEDKIVPLGVYYWFPGWHTATPPYPFGPMTATPVQTQSAVLQVTAIDQWGAMATADFRTSISPGCKGGTK